MLFCKHKEWVDFWEGNIPEVQFQWFIDIVIYLHFVSGLKISNIESQQENVHTRKDAEKNNNKLASSRFSRSILGRRP